MGKRLGIKLIMFTIFSCLLLVFNNSLSGEKKIYEVVEADYNKTTKIVFYDGRGINKPFTVEDRQKINEFIGLINSCIIKKEKKQEIIVGWIHAADFYSGEKKLMKITFTNPLQINGDYYNIVKGELNSKVIDDFIDSINSGLRIP